MDTIQPLPCSLPDLIQEDLIQEELVKQFTFFAENSLHTGMSFGYRLYALHHSFGNHDRAHAFAVASTLSHQGATTVVTVSSQNLVYKVWVDLRHISCVCSTSLVEDVSSNINTITKGTSYQLVVESGSR